MLTSLRNKAVIVTGGTRGIGRGIAGVFTTLGAWVCVIGRNEADGVAAVEALRSSGGTAIFYRGGVTQQAAMAEAAATVAAAFGGIDILCANAGIFPATRVEEMSENVLTAGVRALGQAYLTTMAAAIPLQRLGTVEEIGHAVAFLASEEAGFITGQTLVVDGGQTLPESPQALEG